MSTSTPTAESTSARAERDQRTVNLLLRASRSHGQERQEALDEAVELNIVMARRLASRYFHRGIPDDDLEQVACLALVKAVRGFDAAKSERFAAYAIPTIRGELRRHFRDAGWTVRPPRKVQELQAQVRDAEAELSRQLNRPPAVVELVEALGVDASDVREVLDLGTCFQPTSIDAPTSADGQQSLGELLPATETGFQTAETRLLLLPLIQELSERERWILHLRFVEDLKQHEIGQRLDVSQVQVSRILTSIYARLREGMGDLHLTAVA